MLIRRHRETPEVDPAFDKSPAETMDERFDKHAREGAPEVPTDLDADDPLFVDDKPASKRRTARK